MKAGNLVQAAVARLLDSPAIDHWQEGREEIEANELLNHVLGRTFKRTTKVPSEAAERFTTLVDRRMIGEPVAYLTGSIEFRNLRLATRPGVFIPRAYSEHMVELSVVRLGKRKHPTHLDLATGSGAVALAVASEVPKATVVGTDIATDAIKLGRKNAKELRLKNVTFHQGDLFAPVPSELTGKVDVITIHPPYVAVDELDTLPDEVRLYEPIHTLSDGSEDGLGLVNRTADEGRSWLRKGGWLLMEVSPDRARAVRGSLLRHGYREVKSRKEPLFGVTRVVVGRR